MTEIIDLDEFRPHVAFKAFCGHCGFKWIAITPDAKAIFGLECRECKRMTGFPTGESMEED